MRDPQPVIEDIRALCIPIFIVLSIAIASLLIWTGFTEGKPGNKFVLFFLGIVLNTFVLFASIWYLLGRFLTREPLSEGTEEGFSSGL